MNKIIAVVGMCGSGKSIATEILEKEGWHKVYFGGVTYKKWLKKELKEHQTQKEYLEKN